MTGLNIVTDYYQAVSTGKGPDGENIGLPCRRVIPHDPDHLDQVSAHRKIQSLPFLQE
jgi:hypothetical protein